MKPCKSSSLLAGFLAAMILCGCVQAQNVTLPHEGFIPDERTAIRVAEAVLEPLLGARNVKKNRPFRAVLHDGEWIVTGTKIHSKNSDPTIVHLGGVAVVRIDRASGRIIEAYHGK